MINTEKNVRTLNENKFLGINQWELYPFLRRGMVEFNVVARVKKDGETRIHVLSEIEADIWAKDYEHESKR